MSVRIVQAEGRVPGPVAVAAEDTHLIDWRSERRNALLDCSSLPLPRGERRSLALDLLDLAVGVYLADLAVERGRNEDWVRNLRLELNVREADFWQAQAGALSRLLGRLSGDTVEIVFHPREGAEPEMPWGEPGVEVDCVSLLSGGLDSAAGAAMLLRTGRHPRLVLHRSGNPMVAEAQDRVAQALQGHFPDQAALSYVRLAPSSHRTGAWAFVAPERRETSRRCRSFLFATLGAVAGAGEGVSEVYLCDNALLTSAVPLSEARVAGFTTHSTHPAVIAGLNRLLAAANLGVGIVNPFLYQAKGELIRTCLQPVLAPREIAHTISCWAVGRHQRQCGGCVPCLLRRVALLAAGLPDEVYAIDLFASPERYRGTEAYRNLVDLMGWSLRVLSTPHVQLPLRYPALLEVEEGGGDVMDLVHALRRQATEILEVVQRCFPETARLMGGLG